MQVVVVGVEHQPFIQALVPLVQISSVVKSVIFYNTHNRYSYSLFLISDAIFRGLPYLSKHCPRIIGPWYSGMSIGPWRVSGDISYDWRSFPFVFFSGISH